MARTEWDGLFTTNGGTFEELYVNGVVTCHGNVEARELELNGILTVNGLSTAQNKLTVDGVATLGGDVRAGEAEIDGTMTVKGNMEVANSLQIDGTVTVRGNVRAKEAEMDGVCTIEGNLEADTVECEGVLTCKNQISADLVECDGVISAKEIVGEKVILRCEKKRFWSHKEYSKIDLIEATEVEINGVRCQNVNGHNITIGEYCTVEHVDCTGVLKIAPGAKVGKIN